MNISGRMVQSERNVLLGKSCVSTTHETTIMSKLTASDT